MQQWEDIIWSENFIYNFLITCEDAGVDHDECYTAFKSFVIEHGL